MIIWITGLSAAGKTTIGREVARLWKGIEPNTVFIDGDEIRQLFKQEGSEKDYSVNARRISSERMVALCEWLDRQGINAVSCNIAMFADIRRRNRKVYGDYFEVFLDVSLHTLKHRDPKGLYAQFDKGEMRNVVGLDIPFETEQTHDIALNNDGNGVDINVVARHILKGAFKSAGKKSLADILLKSPTQNEREFSE